MLKPTITKALAAITVGLACLSVTPAALAQNTTAATLDMNNPEDVLKSDRKIQSSLNDGEESVYYWEGNVYTRIAGERDKHLFKYWGMNIRATKGFQDPVKGYGYRMVSRELLFYLDPKTGEIMRTWKNPWSQETVDIVHIANDPVNMPPQFAKGDRGPTKFRGTVMEDKVMYTYEIPLFYANPLAGDYQDFVGGTYHAMEIFNFIADKKELMDATKTTAYPSIAWSRVSKFLPWMKMGDRQGYMIFSGTGKKLAGGFNALPDGIKKEIATNYPIYNKAPPLDDARPNETSWTYFKTEMEKKKAKK